VAYEAPKRLELFALEGLPQVTPGADLAALILAACERPGCGLLPGDIVVVAQKIVSKAEGRRVRLADVTACAEATSLAARTGKDPRLVELILRESNSVLRVGREVLIVEHRSGWVLANAGIDQSNVGTDTPDTHALLLPIDCDASALKLRQALAAACGHSPAVVIIDSIGRAWRRGTVGQTLGSAGLPVVVDLRGRQDLERRRLRASDLALVDEVAAAASLLMGQADEARPVVIVRGLTVSNDADRAVALQRAHHEDLFR